MTCPSPVDYTDTTFFPQHRPGVMAALYYGDNTVTLPPTVDVTEWTQRDINEMLSRGWLQRAGRRTIDGAIFYKITPQGVEAARRYRGKCG